MPTYDTEHRKKVGGEYRAKPTKSENDGKEKKQAVSNGGNRR
jgi:hypothetical protein